MFLLLLTVIVHCSLTTSAFACLVWWHCHFVPNYMMKVKLIKYWMPNIFLKKYTHGKWGLGEAFNQNSLMQLFNGDRRIVHWVCLFLPVEKSRRGLHHCCVHLMWFKKIDNYVCLMCSTLQSRLLIYQPIYLLQLIYPVHMHLCPKLPHLPTSLPAIGEFFGAQNVVSVNHPLDNKHMYVDPAAVSDFVANILWR